MATVIPLVFRRLTIGNESEKLVAHTYLIRKFSNHDDDDIYEATTAAIEMYHTQSLDYIIGELVTDYTNTYNIELKVCILKVLSWLFSKIWMENNETGRNNNNNNNNTNISSYRNDHLVFGINSKRAIKIYIECLYSNNLRYMMSSLFMLGQQDVPCIFNIVTDYDCTIEQTNTTTTNNNNTSNNNNNNNVNYYEDEELTVSGVCHNAILHIVKGIYHICCPTTITTTTTNNNNQSYGSSYETNNTNTFDSNSNSNGNSISAISSITNSIRRTSSSNRNLSWKNRPVESHQILLTVLLNISQQLTNNNNNNNTTTNNKYNLSPLQAFASYCCKIGLIEYIISKYIINNNNILRIYAMRFLQVLYPSLPTNLFPIPGLCIKTTLNSIDIMHIIYQPYITLISKYTQSVMECIRYNTVTVAVAVTVYIYVYIYIILYYEVYIY